MKLSWPKGRGWDLLRRALTDIDRNNLFGLASQLAYRLPLCASPLRHICLVALAAFLPVRDLVQQLLQFLQPFLPPPWLRPAGDRGTAARHAAQQGDC